MVLPPSEVWQFGLAKLGIFKNEWPHVCVQMQYDVSEAAMMPNAWFQFPLGPGTQRSNCQC